MRFTDVLLVGLGVLVLVAAVLAWENRGSEKIVTAVIPTTIAAVAAVVLTIAVFGNQPPRVEVFPAVFHYNLESGLPWDAPWGIGDRWIADSYQVPAKLKQLNPVAFTFSSDEAGLLLYHQLLQWSVVRWLAATYGANWRAEIRHFNLPDSREGSARSTHDGGSDISAFTSTQIEESLRGNPFASLDVAFPPNIAVPLGTRLSIAVPRATSGAGVVALENDLFTLRIETTLSGYKHSLGTYAQLAGIDEERDRHFMKAIYLVKVTVELSRWKIGHPKMTGYRNWIDQLVAELKDSFSEEAVWTRIRDEYLLRRQIHHLGPLIG